MQEDFKKVSPDNSGSKYSDIYEEARDKVFGKLINERINTDMRGKDFLKRKLDREGYEIVRKNVDNQSEK